MHVSNTYRNYSPKEVFDSMQEECRLLMLYDIEVDEGLELTRDMTIYDWRQSLDLIPWRKLFRACNDNYRLSLPKSDWFNAVLPEQDKTLWDLCLFISQHAIKEVINPVNICGNHCMSTAVFLTLKKNLASRGIEPKGLRPSTLLSCVLDIKTLPYFTAELCTFGVRTFECLLYQNNRVDTGDLITFGDLSKTIAKNLSLKVG